MADQDKESRRTRRAKRREQPEAAGGQAPERDEVESEPPERPAARAGQAASPQTGRESIRDRNQRLRQKAAEERRQRRSEKVEDVPVGLGASEMVDDVLARTAHTATRWIKRHSTLVQSAIVLGFASLIGISAWRIYARDAKAKQSDALFTAVETRLAPVGESPEILNPEGRSLDPRPTFASIQERNAKAEEAYRSVAGSGRPVAVLGELGLAGALYDAGKYDEARAAYDAVRSSKLADRHVEFKARAIEGVGLSLEAKGDLEGAAKAFGELENVSDPALSNLGVFHRARLALRKGDKQQAKELVNKLKQKLDKPEDESLMFSYTALATSELSQVIDPAGTPWMPGLGAMEDTKQGIQNMQRWVEQISKGELPADLMPAGSASAAPAGAVPSAASAAAPAQAPASAPPSTPTPAPAASP